MPNYTYSTNLLNKKYSTPNNRIRNNNHNNNNTNRGD